MDHPAANEIADLVGGKLGPGEHREHAGRGRGFRRIDALESRVRVRRAHEIGVSLSRPADVVGVVAFAGDETLVLLAAHRGADPGRAHGLPPWMDSSFIVWSMIFFMLYAPPPMARAPAAIDLTMLW